MKIEIETIRPAYKEMQCVGFKCDSCGKEVFGGHSADMSYRQTLHFVPDSWFTIEVRSNSDGYEETYTRNEVHVCSALCYMKAIERITQDMEQKYDYLYHVSSIPMSIMREIARRISSLKSQTP